jgi:translocation and assembly module TamB
MKRTMPRWLRRLSRAFATIVAVVVTLGGVLFLLLQTPAAKRVVAERLASRLTAASGFQVQIGAVEGTLPFDAAITDVRVSDANGLWLTVDRLEIGWRPTELLAGRLHVTGMAADEVTLAHLPASVPEQPTDKRGVDLSLALPQLPLPTIVDGLRIERILLAPTVAGEPATLNLSGRAELGGVAREAVVALAIARIDGRKGTVGLQLGQNGSPARLTLDVEVDEPAGGLIARALSLPGLPPVSLRLAGNGLATDWRGRLQAVAGPTRLAGDLGLAIDDALAVDLTAHAQEAGRLVPDIAAFVPPSFDIAARLRWQPGRRLDVARLAIAAPEATAKVTGGLDLDGERVQASFDVAIADATRWSPLLAPASIRAARLAGSVSGPLDQPEFELQVAADDLTAPDFAAAHAEAKVAGRATLRDGHVVSAVSLAADGSWSGMTVADAPELAAMMGGMATWSVRGNFDLVHGNAKIEQAKLAANGSTVEAAGSIGDYGHAVAATVQTELADIAPLAALLDRSAAGRVSVTAKLSGDAIVPRLAGDVGARFADLAVDEPTVTKLLGVAPTITGRLLVSPAAIDIGALKIEGAGGTVTADGTVGLDGRSLDLNIATAVADISPVATSFGVSAGGRLAGKLQLTRSDADPRYRFAGSADLDDFALDERTTDLLGPIVHARAEGVLSDTAIQLDSAEIVGAAIRLAADGRVADGFDLDYHLELPRLAALSPIVGTDLAGNATISGDLTGSREAPVLSGALSGDGLGVGGLAIPSAEGKFSARELGAHPQGELALDLVAGAQRLSFSTTYQRWDDGAVALSDLKLTAPRTKLAGNLTVQPSGLLDGRVRGEVGDLAPIGALIDRSVAGAATLDLSFAAAEAKQAIDAAIDVRSPSFAGAGDPPLSARRLMLKARVGDAFDSPGGTVELRVTEAAASGLSVTQLDLKADGNSRSLKVSLQADGTRGHPFAVDARGVLALAADEQDLQLDRLNWSFGPLKSHLNGTASFSRDGRGFTLAGLDASIGDGRLTGAGSAGTRRVDLRLSLADLPLDVITVFLPKADIGGKATADLHLAGTPAAPTAHADIRLADISVAGTKISEATGIGGTIKLDVQDGRAAVAAHLGGSPDLTIDGEATAPLAFRLQPFALELASDAAVSGKVNGRIDLAVVPRVADLHGDALAGRLDIDMTVAGTVASPRFAGEARVSDGSYASADAGTVFRDVTAVIAGDDSRVRLQSLTAGDGDKGRLSASGAVTLRGADRVLYEGELTLQHFTILNRSDAVAVASGTLQLTDEAQGSRLGGEVTVESAELRVPETLPPKIVKLDVVEVNAPAGTVQPAREKQEGVALPVALGVTVKIPGHAFLRGRGIESEWRGKLRVVGTMAAPDITGRLEVVRGRIDLLGRPFEVETGKVEFVGGGAIDPELDFIANGQAEDLTVNVHVTGVASAPKFELGTDSGLPPEEALAQVLFGKTAGSLSPAQAIQLAQAAAALSGGGPGVLDKMRRTFGLDVLRVGTSSGSADSTSVTAGKYISDNVFLKVEQGLTPESRNVGVEVRVLPRVTVEGGVGIQGDSKVGVNWRYDY